MNRAEALAHVAKLTTQDRNLTHGDPIAQFETAQQLKDELARGPRWMDLNAVEREAAEMICTKLSRWVHGDPNQPGSVDHPLDIIGYAAIAIESRHEHTLQAGKLAAELEQSENESVKALAKKFAPRGM